MHKISENKTLWGFVAKNLWHLHKPIFFRCSNGAILATWGTIIWPSLTRNSNFLSHSVTPKVYAFLRIFLLFSGSTGFFPFEDASTLHEYDRPCFSSARSISLSSKLKGSKYVSWSSSSNSTYATLSLILFLLAMAFSAFRRSTCRTMSANWAISLKYWVSNLFLME